ncbi:MAG: hypothetical protein ACE5KX_01570, partial [Acidimicrobiia bacterium]
PVMAVPLLALAGGSLLAGLINTPFRPALEHFLEPAFEGVGLTALPGGATPWVLAVVSVAAGLAGIALASGLYLRRARPKEASPAWRLLGKGYYVDDLYGNVFGRLAKLGAAWTAFRFDTRVIDGLVDGVGVATRRVGAMLRPIQTGFVRNYGLVVMAGAVALLAWFLSRGAF